MKRNEYEYEYETKVSRKGKEKKAKGCFCYPEILQFLKGNISKELKISPTTKFIYHGAFLTQSCMLMKQNVNNDVSKDCPIVDLN